MEKRDTKFVLAVALPTIALLVGLGLMSNPHFWSDLLGILLGVAVCAGFAGTIAGIGFIRQRRTRPELFRKEPRPATPAVPGADSRFEQALGPTPNTPVPLYRSGTGNPVNRKGS